LGGGGVMLAAQAMLVRFGCGHAMRPAAGDRLMAACPACHPPEGEEPWNLQVANGGWEEGYEEGFNEGYERGYEAAGGGGATANSVMMISLNSAATTVTSPVSTS
jgi:hypothetical protein